MSAFFNQFKGRNGQWYFTLHAANGEPILQSEGYVTQAGADNGIASVRTNSPHDGRYGRHQSSAGYWFTLHAANNEILGRSEMYTSQYARDNGIESVKRNAPTAPVRRAAA